MPSRAVLNTSPLIFLSKAGRLELVRHVAAEILVPEEVEKEIRMRPFTDAAVQAPETTPWLKVFASVPVPAALQGWDLGPGETSVLACAYANRPTVAIIDDLSARRCAGTFGIPISGTLVSSCLPKSAALFL